MEIDRLSPKDIIEESWLVSYEQNVEAIWWQLVRLNSTIFVLEKILSFPFDLFHPLPATKHFWNLVENALFETCILIIWRVGVDTVYTEGLTLQQFKNQVFQHLKTDEYRIPLKKALKKDNVQSSVSDLEKKIRELRNNYIAHYNLQRVTNPTAEQIRQRIFLPSELKQYQNTLNGYFDLLCFGHKRAVLPLEYHPDVTHPLGFDSQSDIERLLDNVARESALLNLPEKNPAYWFIYRQNLSEKSLKILNEYRAKFELPAV